MGAAISYVRDQISKLDEENKKKTLEQLEFLVNAANSKLDKYQNELEDMFTDPGTVDKRMIPGIRAMRWERGYRVGVEKSAAEGGLGEIVDGFFGVTEDALSDKEGQQKNKDIIGGFKKIVGGALSAILGNTNAGQQEEQKFFIYMDHNAVIRIDVKIWRYNFSNKGIMGDSENVFCYIFCTSVVDSSKLYLDELTFLMSEYAGDDGVQPYVNKLLEVWGSIHKMHSFIQRKGLPSENGGSLPLPPPAEKRHIESAQEERVVRRRIAAPEPAVAESEEMD